MPFSIPTLSPVPNVVAVGGLVGDWLRDPGGPLSRAVDAIARSLLESWPISVPIAVGVVVAVVLGRRQVRRRRAARLAAGARQITVLAPPTVDPAGGEAFWANLTGLLRPRWRRVWSGQPHLGLEYLFAGAGVAIRIWVPAAVPPGLVERAIEAAWPGAHTHTAPAQTPLPAPSPAHAAAVRAVVTGGELRLARPEALPLRTRFDTDPVRAVLGAAVGLDRHEYACVQVLARPVTGRRAAHARRSATHLRHPNARRPGLVVGLLREVLDLLTPGPLTRPRPARTATRPGRDPQTVLDIATQNRAVVDKHRGPQYETLVRYAVTAHLPTPSPDPDHLRAAQDAVRGRAHALAGAFASYNEHNRYTRRRLRHPATTLAARRLDRGDVLSVRELAAIAHLPTDDHIPGLLRAGARAVAPPPGIAAPGPDAKTLGVTDTGHPRPVALRVPDARHHLHVIGATGAGKSTLLATMLLDDATAGRGILLVDPKGDLVTDLLDRLPRRCGDRVVLLDADSPHRPPCLNPLDTHPSTGTDPADPGGGAAADLAVDNLVSVFRRVYTGFWGPRTDDVMRAACLTLTRHTTTPTLAQLPALLTDPARRARLTAAVTDPVLHGFWAWYDQLTDASRAQMIAPLLNKLRAFLLRPFVRDALAAGSSTLDMRAVLDGGICLVRIPKGSLGEDTTRLVGSLVVAAAWQATTARARTPQPHRRDASLVIDECHNFLNLPYPIEDMLAEARGFRVAMTLAHQHLGQLPRELRDGLSTNARSKIFFTAGPEDARDLARHTTPQLTEHDLTHLGVFHAAARLVSDGEHTPAFTLHTRPLPPPVPGRAAEIRAAALATTAHRAGTRTPPRGVPAPGGGAAQHPATTPPGALRPVTADPRRRT